MSKGIISIYWGDQTRLPIERLKISIKKYHPELEHVVIKLDEDPNKNINLDLKALMFDLSPFDETLFLDIDTVVMGRLDFGFEMARQHKLAISLCESPWARRYTSLFQGDEIEYNTGVIFFNNDSKFIFDKWKSLSKTLDTSLVCCENGNVIKMPANDQGSFAMALNDLHFNPFILPYNWNFRPSSYRSFFGPIKIWHDYSDPPEGIHSLNQYYEKKDSVIQFHYLS